MGRDKKEWKQPEAVVQVFVPNEYVAACYKIKCNVPSGTGYHETNGKNGYQEGNWFQKGDDYIASGRGCGVWHVGVHLDAAPTENAMWDPDRGDAYPVFHWSTGRGNNNQHFSKVSDAQWETNPNAS